MTKNQTYVTLSPMKRLARLFTPFQRLQWRLTLSYTLVTTGALLVVELLLFTFIFFLLGSDMLAGIMAQAMQNELAPAARPYLAQTPPDVSGLQAWAESLIDTQTQLSPTAGVQETTSLRLGQFRMSDAEQQLYVLAPDLSLLAQAPHTPMAVGEPWLAAEFPDSAVLLQTARQGSQVIAQGENEAQLVALPILSEEGVLLGLLVLVFRIPLLHSEFLRPILQATAASLIPITIATALIGTVFGYLTARNLTRRIRHVANAADAWSQGDFSVASHDNAGDELGQLSRRLNRMAEQLQNLLEARQELAAVEERNRLARDLHDSVKQQVFATTMQLAAARALLTSDARAAGQHLVEAEQLARQAQQELTGLIQELRPVALADRGLAEALQTYVADWGRQTQIEATVRVQGARPLPLPTEQTLFRVAQEALANVTRHSQARRVDLHLTFSDTAVTLTIHDDGRGFVPEAANTGLGLASMRERMAVIDGRFTIHSTPGKGTTVVAEVMYDA
ncbi:MAG: sensor histidine kinase [Anaerolineae bacterium]|nr:sensor histidine kinase [Anaerolineae bacterium]